MLLVHRARNFVAIIRSKNGHELIVRPSIAKEFEDYFQSKWNTPLTLLANVELDMIPHTLDKHDSEWLFRPITMAKLDRVVKSLPGDKAPGPDGFSAMLYKAHWSIVKDILFEAMSQFTNTAELPLQWKSTFVEAF